MPSGLCVSDVPGQRQRRNAFRPSALLHIYAHNAKFEHFASHFPTLRALRDSPTRILLPKCHAFRHVFKNSQRNCFIWTRMARLLRHFLRAYLVNINILKDSMRGAFSQGGYAVCGWVSTLNSYLMRSSSLALSSRRFSSEGCNDCSPKRGEN